MEDVYLGEEVITQPEHTPAELAMEIRKYTGDTTQNIIKIGQLLTEAKKRSIMANGKIGFLLMLNSRFVLPIDL